MVIQTIDPEENCPRLELGFGSGLGLVEGGKGAIFLGGNFPKTNYFQYISNCTTIGINTSCKSYSHPIKFEDILLIKNLKKNKTKKTQNKSKQSKKNSEREKEKERKIDDYG